MKRKTLLLTISAAMSVAIVGTVIAVANSNDLMRSRANAREAGSVVFSRSTGSFTKIDDRTASISGKTAKGSTYYAVSHNYDDISSTNYIARFVFNPLDPSGPSLDSQYVSFSSTANGVADFEFQAVTGIKVTTTSSMDQTLYVVYSDDGETYCDYTSGVEVTANTAPTKVSFSSSYKYVRLVTASGTTKNIKEIELFYDCGEEPGPGERALVSIEAKSPKKRYGLNAEFVEPTVEATYSNGDKETVAGATFSGYSLSTLGEQTVTVTYEDKSTTYDISVRPTETSLKIAYEAFDYTTYEMHTDVSEVLDMEQSTLVYYAEPESNVSFTPVFKGSVNIYGADEKDGRVEEISFDGTTFSFEMCRYFDITIDISYQSISEMTGIRVDNPTTVYYIGDTFDEPTVYAVYDSGSEVKLTEGVTFSGFNSSSAVESQTITVSYNNGEFTTTYPVTIKNGGQPTDVSGTYKSEQSTGNTKYRSVVTLNADGSTGTYVVEKTMSSGDLWTYEIILSYSVDGTNVTLTFSGFGKRTKYAGGPGGTPTDYGTITSLSTWFDPYRPFVGSNYTAGTTSQVATLNEGVMTMKRYSSSTDSQGTALSLTKQ